MAATLIVALDDSPASLLSARLLASHQGDASGSRSWRCTCGRARWARAALGAVHHALIGSVALKVALASPVPVVLVP